MLINAEMKIVGVVGFILIEKTDYNNQVRKVVRSFLWWCVSVDGLGGSLINLF